MTTDDKGSFIVEGIDAQEVKIVVDDLEYDKLEKIIKLGDLAANPNFVLEEIYNRDSGSIYDQTKASGKKKNRQIGI